MKTKTTKTDIAIIVIILCFTLAVSFFFLKKATGSYVKVVSPDGTYLYPLSKDAEYSFEGIMGTSKIVVQDGYVAFTDSPCPNKNCISNGAISKADSFNACLPNGISLTIVGDKGNEVDAVSI